jgi:hypothetical protein
MNAGNSSPFRSIVHARQVIEEQRRGVEVFERDGQIFGVFTSQAVSNSHLIDQPGTDETPVVIENMT